MDDEPTGPGFWTVTVVLADRAYGGPEEGGWYYDTTDPFDPGAVERTREAKAERLFHDTADAIAYTRTLDERCAAWNKEERRPRKDSLLSRGVYEAGLFRGWPTATPAERPRYE